MNERIITLILCAIAVMSCSSLGEKKTNEIYLLKNQASDNTKTANTLINQYEYRKAAAFYLESLKYNIMADNISGIIRNYADLGKVHMLLQEFDTCLDYYLKAYNLADSDTQSTYKIEKAYVLNGLGEAYYLQMDYSNAESNFLKAQVLEEELGNKENQAIILQNLAKIQRKREDYDRAIKGFLKSAALMEPLFKSYKLQNPRSLSLAYYSLALTYSKKQEYDQGILFAKKALAIDKIIENSGGIADDYFALGKLHEMKELPSEAHLYYERSAEIYKILGHKDQYLELMELLDHLSAGDTE